MPFVARNQNVPPLSIQILENRKMLNRLIVGCLFTTAMVARRRKKVSFWKIVKVPKRVKVEFYVSTKRKKKKRS